ncbi:MAG: hypothetical protein JEZ09_00810 [Salinivirgaceae bacterium]|nr:hypothetical protein [Salinivirgaceae bacterium]
MKYFRINILLAAVIVIGVILQSSFEPDKKKKAPKESIQANVNANGTILEFMLVAGKEHNHPTFAFWIENLDGTFVQELFVTKSLSTGIYGHGQKVEGVWDTEPGEVRRPATLPYFLHKRGVKAEDGTYLPTPKKPIVDAYTGATPAADFDLEAKSNEKLSGKYRILFELNQSWDWNEFWNNTKHIDELNYKTSCQPALVYSVVIDFDNPMDYYALNPMGHSHYSGKTGELFTDISTLTTAKHIFDKIEVRVKK